MLDELTRADEKFNTTLSSGLGQLRKELERILNWKTRSSNLSEDLTGTVRTILQESRRVRRGQLILSSLRYDIQYSRYDAVAETYESTYQWIFRSYRKQSNQQRPQVDFTDWLEHGAGIFWISGKAGSGKSTLMKFICDRRDTQLRLQDWAGQAILVTASHFFWNAGASLQKSQVGLLRALCFEILRCCPSLSHVLCKERWEENTRSSSAEDSWSLHELAKVIARLKPEVLQAVGRSYCFCFFIDGLDEYEGDHAEIVSIMQDLSASPNIKICVSSRPWNVFHMALGGAANKMLKLEDLTSGDIHTYANGKLRRNHRFIEMQMQNNRCEEFVLEITRKAQGVFLWVFLVVRELQKSLENGDTFHDLKRRLDSIPPDLYKYFRVMFDKLEDFYKTQSAQIFLTCIRSRLPLALIAFAVFEPSDDEEIEILQAEVDDPEELTRLERLLRLRINSRCCDLLEIRPTTLGQIVDFLHRTVRDFLRTADIALLLEERAGSSFIPLEQLCRMELVIVRRLRYLCQDELTLERLSVHVDLFGTYVREMEEQFSLTPVDVLDQLEEVRRHVRRWKTVLSFNSVLHEPSFHHPMDDNDHIMAFCVKQSLCLYLEHRAVANPGLFSGDRGKRYLSLAVEELLLSPGTVAVTSKPRTIATLLKCGVDPNGQHVRESISIWGRYLEILCHQKRKDSWNHKAGNDKRDTFEAIAEAFILAGASYMTCVQYPGGVSLSIGTTSSEKDILTSAFGKSSAQQLFQLRQPEFPGWISRLGQIWHS